MTCQEFVAFLMDYLTGELPSDVRARFEEHIAECDDCRHFMDSYQTTIAVSRLACRPAPNETAASEVAPAELVAAILRAIQRG